MRQGMRINGHKVRTDGEARLGQKKGLNFIQKGYRREIHKNRFTFQQKAKQIVPTPCARYIAVHTVGLVDAMTVTTGGKGTTSANSTQVNCMRAQKSKSLRHEI